MIDLKGSSGGGEKWISIGYMKMAKWAGSVFVIKEYRLAVWWASVLCHCGLFIYTCSVTQSTTKWNS